jgi:hypothetical protein
MNKFDAKVSYILKEGILSGIGSVAKGVGEFTASGMEAAQNPLKAIEILKRKNPDKKNPYAYSDKNPPKVNDVAVYNKKPMYKAKVVKGLNGEGNYGIAPVGSNNTPATYSFVRTVDQPNKWRPVDNKDLNTQNMTVKGVAIVNKDANGQKIDYQLCPSAKIPYIYVGNTNTDIDEWIKEDVYNNAQKATSQPQPAQVQPQPQPQRKRRTPTTPVTPRINQQQTTT